MELYLYDLIKVEEKLCRHYRHKTSEVLLTLMTYLKTFLSCKCLKVHYIFIFWIKTSDWIVSGSHQNIWLYHKWLTPRSSLFRNASLAASQLSARSACSLNSCSWYACVSFCRRSSHATPNVRLNSSRCARLGARSSWPPPTGRRIPKCFSDLNASCRPSISAWPNCDNTSWEEGKQTHI